MNSFSPTAIIGQGWSIFRDRWVDYYKATIVVIFVAFATSYGGGIVEEVLGSFPAALYRFFTFYVNSVLAIGYMRVYLQIVRDEPLELDVLYKHYKDWGLIFTFVGTQIIYTFVGFLGLLLLIIPGIYFLLKYLFVQLLVADQGLSIGEAFKKSAKMTEGIKIKLIVYALLTFSLGILGLLLLLVGSLVTGPVVSLSGGVLYDRLRK